MEEILVLNLFPSFARDFFVLNDLNSEDILEKAGKKIEELFDDKKENYIISNWKYSAVAIFLLLALTLTFNYFSMEYMFMGLAFILLFSIVWSVIDGKLLALIFLPFILSLFEILPGFNLILSTP